MTTLPLWFLALGLFFKSFQKIFRLFKDFPDGRSDNGIILKKTSISEPGINGLFTSSRSIFKAEAFHGGGMVKATQNTVSDKPEILVLTSKWLRGDANNAVVVTKN